jgi:BirA family biotin operon repressor/biotin-[acetyl-CoA-carboxylase] ligase
MRPLEYRVLPQIDSTQAYAKAHLEEFSKQGLAAIQALEQTSGRGQYGRGWHSPAFENVYLTFAFQTDAEIEPIRVTHLLALSTLTILEPLLPHSKNLQIKWPNDVLYQRQKIAGILCERITYPDSAAIILGIGLNVNMTDFSSISQLATSIKSQTGHSYDPEVIGLALSHQFQQDLFIFEQKGFEPFVERLSTHLIVSQRSHTNFIIT